MAKVPGVKTTQGGGVGLSLVSPDEAAGPARAFAASQLSVAESMGAATREGVASTLRVELDRVKRRHVRETSEAKTQVLGGLSTLSLDFDANEHDFDTMVPKYAEQSQELINDILGGVADQDVLDVVQGYAQAEQQQHMLRQQSRANGLELKAEKAAFATNATALAQSAGLAGTDEMRSAQRHQYDLLVGSSVLSGTITEAEGIEATSKWIDAAAQTAARAALRDKNNLAVNLEELLNPGTEKYNGMNPEQRQIFISAAAAEIKRLTDTNSAERRAANDASMTDIFQRTMDPNHQNPLGGPEGLLEILYDYPDLTATSMPQAYTRLVDKNNGVDINRTDFDLAFKVLDEIIAGDITTRQQIEGLGGKGLAFSDVRALVSMVEGINEKDPQKREINAAWAQFVNLAKDVKAPKQGLNGVPTAAGAKDYYDWYRRTQDKWLAAREDPNVNPFDLLDRNHPSYIGGVIEPVPLRQKLGEQFDESRGIPTERNLPAPPSRSVEELDRVLDGRAPAPGASLEGGVTLTETQEAIAAIEAGGPVMSRQRALAAGVSVEELDRVSRLFSGPAPPDPLGGLNVQERAVQSLLLARQENFINDEQLLEALGQLDPTGIIQARLPSRLQALGG